MIHFCNVSKSMSAWPMVFSIFSPHSVILSISSPFAIFNPSTVRLELSAAFTRSFKASRCLSMRCSLFVVRRENCIGFLSSYRDMFQFCLERLLYFVKFRWFCSHSKLRILALVRAFTQISRRRCHVLETTARRPDNNNKKHSKSQFKITISLSNILTSKTTNFPIQ